MYTHACTVFMGGNVWTFLFFSMRAARGCVYYYNVILKSDAVVTPYKIVRTHDTVPNFGK